MPYRIGKFAELSGVSVKTLRFYDQIGLLRPASVNARTRYRGYLAQQFEQLAAILELKSLGAKLPEIKRTLAGGACGGNYETLLRALARETEHEIRRQEQRLAAIGAVLEQARYAAGVRPIVVKECGPMQVAAVRVRVNDYGEMAFIERELLRAVPMQLHGDQRGVLWHSCAGDSAAIEGEAFLQITRAMTSRGELRVKQLPSVLAASTYADDNDADADRAYRALRRWMDTNGCRLAGPKRELYRDGKLEIQFPLRRV